MVSICLTDDHRGHALEQWSYVASHWQIDRLFVLGNAPSEWRKVIPFREVVEAASLAELAPHGRLVVAAPAHGRYLPGTVALPEYEHPEHAVYFFGSDHRYPTPELVEGLEHERVCIPTDTTHDMYSWVACAVFLYDRMVKRG